MIPLLHKLLYAKVLLVLTIQGFVEFASLQAWSLHTQWVPAILYGCLYT